MDENSLGKKNEASFFRFCAALLTLLMMTALSLLSKRPVYELLQLYFSLKISVVLVFMHFNDQTPVEWSCISIAVNGARQISLVGL